MKIYLDYDGTIIEYNKYLFQDLENEINEKVQMSNLFKLKNEIANVYNNEKFEKLGYYKNAIFFNGAKEFIEKNIENGISIEFITSSMSSEQKKYKTEHIKLHFPFLENKIIYARKKYEHSKDGVFIDDNLKKVYEHIINNNEIGILANFQNRNLLEEKEETHEKIIELLKDNPNFYIVNNFSDVDKIIELILLKEKENINRIEKYNKMEF